jgi:hypothetical protein
MESGKRGGVIDTKDAQASGQMLGRVKTTGSDNEGKVNARPSEDNGGPCHS